MFLRADRLEGSADKTIEATGKVELRTRRETVLADWLQYDVPNDEVWAKGDVTLRKGLDWISGPEVKFKRDRETGYFDEPQFFISENQSHGEAKEIRFAGPDLYEATQRAVHDLRRAQQRLVPAQRRDRGRQAAQGRHRARRQGVLPRRAGDVHAVARVPAVERAQVGLPHADDRLDADPRLRVLDAVLLQSRAELRPHADPAHHDHAAACMVAAAGPLPVPASHGRGHRPKSCPTTASADETRWALVGQAQPAVPALARRATSTTTACPTRPTSPTSPTAWR